MALSNSLKILLWFLLSISLTKSVLFPVLLNRLDALVGIPPDFLVFFANPLCTLAVAKAAALGLAAPLDLKYAISAVM